MEAVIEMKRTPDSQDYFGDGGAYGKEYSELQKALVPDYGDAPTIHGELIRCIGRLTYEFYNNGNCNAQEVVREDCQECGGSGWEDNPWFDEDNPDDEDEQRDCSYCGGDCTIETGVTVTEYYQRMINFIRDYSDATKEADNLESFLNSYIHYNFSSSTLKQGTKLYNALCDKVIFEVLTKGKNDDRPNPEYKENA